VKGHIAQVAKSNEILVSFLDRDLLPELDLTVVGHKGLSKKQF
jgi:hypothetical protein